jgi:hypothetical protein
MSFPTALPNAKTDYDNSDIVASADQNAQGVIINEIATAIGITNSTDPDSLNYKINNAVVLDVATGAEINTATDNVKYVTAKAIEDSTVAKIADIPVKATGVETNLGTNDAKFVTPLASKTGKTLVTSYAPAGAGTTTIDLSLGNIFVVTMPAATQTLAISNETVGQFFVVEIINVAGQGALTWFGTLNWADGAEPPLTGVNGKRDSYGFRCTAADTYYGGAVWQNMAV